MSDNDTTDEQWNFQRAHGYSSGITLGIAIGERLGLLDSGPLGCSLDLLLEADKIALPQHDDTDGAGVTNLKLLAADLQASAFALASSPTFTPDKIAAALKLRSLPGVQRYMECVDFLAGTRTRRAKLAPRAALLRALLFPMVQGILWDRVSEGEFGRTLAGEAPGGDIHAELAAALGAVGHEASALEVAENYPAVRQSFFALMATEVGDSPAPYDDEVAVGDPIEPEVWLLESGTYLSR